VEISKLLPKKYIFQGSAKPEGMFVYLSGKPLSPVLSQKIRNHAKGFSWGDDSHESEQLALAVCLLIFGEEFALSFYRTFLFEVIYHLRKDSDFIIELCLDGAMLLWDNTTGGQQGVLFIKDKIYKGSTE